MPFQALGGTTVLCPHQSHPLTLICLACRPLFQMQFSKLVVDVINARNLPMPQDDEDDFLPPSVTLSFQGSLLLTCRPLWVFLVFFF